MIKESWLRFKRFILPTPLAWVAKRGFNLLLRTCKIQVEGLHHLQQSEGSGTILMLWHNRMAMMCEFFARYLPQRPFAAFLSKSRDGEPIAKVVESYSNGSCIRVAHDMRHQALRDTIAYLEEKKGVLLITPDGPKGPRYKVKPGIVFAAKETNAAIIAITWEADRFWEFNSWDGFRLPKPFSTIKIVLSHPIFLSKNEDNKSSIEQLEQALERVTTITT